MTAVTFDAPDISPGDLAGTASPGFPVFQDDALAILGTGGDAVPAGDVVEFTLIRSDRRATKSYSVDAAGRFVKNPEPPLSGGTAHRACLSASEPLADTKAWLEALRPNEVLSPGRLLVPGDGLTLTTKAQLATTRGAITRTKDYLGYPAGLPALVLLDHDAKDLPAPLRTRLDDDGGLLAVLAPVCAEIGLAGMLERASVSAGIRNKITGETTPGGGKHLYFIAKDGGDVARFVAVLHARLVLAGWGWVFITKAGTGFVRSLIDVAASGVPERLAYEADAVLDSPDLEHVPGARACMVHRDGVRLDTTALPDLTPEEAAQLAKVEAGLLAAAQPEIDHVRAGVAQDREAALIAQGVPAAEAQKRAQQIASGGRRLDLDLVVDLDDGRDPAVWQMLQDPGAYHGATGADPLEHGYGGGKNIARWYEDPLNRRLCCYSQAHGGQVFFAHWTARDTVTAWKARRDPDEIARMYRVAVLDDPGDEAALAAAGVPSSSALDFAQEALADLAAIVQRGDWGVLAGLRRGLRGAFDDRLGGLDALGLVDAAAVKLEIARVPPTPRRGSAVALPGSIPGGWEGNIQRTERGTPRPGVANAVLALADGCGLGAHLRWDNATNRMLVIGVPPGSAVAAALGLSNATPAYTDPLTGIPVFQWTDEMLTTARLYLEGWEAGIASKDTARDVVNMLARRNAYSSVAAYLRGVVWDGAGRLDGWLVRHAGAEDTHFNRVALRMWTVAAVARALFPEERSGAAAQVDNILTLVGEQSARKSSFFRELCAVAAWHTENSLGDLGNKDAVIRISSTWIVDMAEGGSLRASEVEAFKQFVTTTAGNIRLPYATAAARLVRRNVFAMTVNQDGAGFLKDGTGNRRFWVVPVEDIDIKQLRRDRDQLWAEAVALFDAGHKWWFDRKDPRDTVIEAEAAAAAEAHRAQTPTEEALRRYVEDAPVLNQRGRASWTRRSVPLTVMGALPDVLADLGMDGSNTGTQRDAKRALTAMGWVSTRINFRNAPVPRNQTVWVAREGATAIKTDTRSKGSTVAFRLWLDAQAAAGAIGLPAPAAPGAAAEFAGPGEGKAP